MMHRTEAQNDRSVMNSNVTYDNESLVGSMLECSSLFFMHDLTTSMILGAILKIKKNCAHNACEAYVVNFPSFITACI